MNASEHLFKKKYRLFTPDQELTNNSVARITANLNQNDEKLFTINPDVFNSKLKYLYSIQKVENSVYDNANNFPLLLTNSSDCCDLNAIMNDYSVSKINYFLEFLKNDMYEEVFSNLSTDETQKILYGLYKLKTSVSQCFANIIDVYEKIFISIKYFYFLNGDYLSNKTQFDAYKKDSEILNDIAKLKEYIKKMQMNMNAVTAIAIKSSKLNIKPEYLRYIQRYGVPHKTMFDEVLLQEIIEEIKRENQQNITIS